MTPWRFLLLAIPAPALAAAVEAPPAHAEFEVRADVDLPAPVADGKSGTAEVEPEEEPWVLQPPGPVDGDAFGHTSHSSHRSHSSHSSHASHGSHSSHYSHISGGGGGGGGGTPAPTVAPPPAPRPIVVEPHPIPVATPIEMVARGEVYALTVKEGTLVIETVDAALLAFIYDSATRVVIDDVTHTASEYLVGGTIYLPLHAHQKVRVTYTSDNKRRAATITVVPGAP